MADPNSAKTNPSAMARRAPTPHAIKDCGPPSVAMIAGTVIKGPVPTMFDMLIEMAFMSPRRRGMLPTGWVPSAGATAGSMLKVCGLYSRLRDRILESEYVFHTFPCDSKALSYKPL